MSRVKFNKKFEPAIRSLIRKYEAGVVSGTCPLCTTARKLIKSTTRLTYCAYCPWVRIDGIVCTSVSARWGISLEDRILRLERWLKLRVPKEKV